MKFILSIYSFIVIIFSVKSFSAKERTSKNDEFKIRSEETQEFFNRTRRTVVLLDKRKLWSDGIVPYYFDFSITGVQRRLIKIAMRQWEESTCVQFVPRREKVHKNYLLIIKTEACDCCYINPKFTSSFKVLNLQDNCYHSHTILHELGHAIGFLHEHSHPNRDKYIRVNYSIIAEDDVIEYQKYSYYDIDTLNLPYDLLSVMHYPYYVIVGNNNSINIPLPEPENQRKFLSNGFTVFNNYLSDGDKTATNLMYRCPKCGKTFFEPTGTFEVSSNGSNEDPERCEWKIRAAEGERIILRIPFLRIYPSYNCLLDYLEIRNGHSPDSPVLGRYCGEAYDIKITASNFLLVIYVKMSLSSSSFFRAEYKTICDQTVEIYNDTVYNFESPNYPDVYIPNKRCLWNFIAPENQRIIIKFNFFALEESINCINDFIKIKENNEPNSRVIGVYCGTIDSLYVQSEYNRLHVEFSSDDIIEDAGFSADVFIVSPIDPLPSYFSILRNFRLYLLENIFLNKSKTN